MIVLKILILAIKISKILASILVIIVISYILSTLILSRFYLYLLEIIKIIYQISYFLLNLFILRRFNRLKIFSWTRTKLFIVIIVIVIALIPVTSPLSIVIAFKLIINRFILLCFFFDTIKRISSTLNVFLISFNWRKYGGIFYKLFLHIFCSYKSSSFGLRRFIGNRSLDMRREISFPIFISIFISNLFHNSD